MNPLFWKNHGFVAKSVRMIKLQASEDAIRKINAQNYPNYPTIFNVPFHVFFVFLRLFFSSFHSSRNLRLENGKSDNFEC